MGFFKQIEGEGAVIVEKGVFRQVPLFERDGYIFVKAKGGFVRLMADGATSVAHTRLDFMSFDRELYKDTLGRLACSPDVKGAKPLAPVAQQKLLGIAGPEEGA